MDCAGDCPYRSLFREGRPRVAGFRDWIFQLGDSRGENTNFWLLAGAVSTLAPLRRSIRFSASRGIFSSTFDSARLKPCPFTNDPSLRFGNGGGVRGYAVRFGLSQHEVMGITAWLSGVDRE